MTKEERDRLINVIEKEARGEEVCDEELIQLAGDDDLFTPLIGKPDLTVEDLQRIADALSEMPHERIIQDAEGKNSQDATSEEDVYREILPFLSNEARMWLRRKGYIDDIDIIDLTDYREASALDPSTLNFKSRDQLRRSLSVQLEKLNELQNYVSELFISAIQDYSGQTFFYTDTVADLAYYITQSYAAMEKLLDAINSQHPND